MLSGGPQNETYQFGICVFFLVSVLENHISIGYYGIRISSGQIINMAGADLSRLRSTSTKFQLT